jgi:hypothetical protein
MRCFPGKKPRRFAEAFLPQEVHFSVLNQSSTSLWI